MSVKSLQPKSSKTQSDRFEGQVAIITGGGSGIGKATAVSFASQGAFVTIVDIDGQAASHTAASITAKGSRCLYIEADIADSRTADRAVSQTMETFGRLDFLFNNAGCELVKPLLETSEQDWDLVIDTNLKGTFMMSQLAVEQMSRTGCGVIINNASDAGLRGIKLNAAYSTSKAGIIHLTKSIALDYAGLGIRCNCICPGCIDTPLCQRFNNEVGARKGESGAQALAKFVENNIPMRRVGTPAEVASVVLFLCSDDAAYINGAIIPIDGGLTAGM